MTGFEKYASSLFRDLRHHSKWDKLHEPSEFYHAREIKLNHMKPGDFELIILRDEPILSHVSENGNLFFYTKYVHLLKDLKKIGETIVIPKEEFVFRILHIVIFEMLGLSVFAMPYDRHRKEFLDKLFYFLEIPVDPIWLKMKGINPDLSTVCVEDFKTLATTVP